MLTRWNYHEKVVKIADNLYTAPSWVEILHQDPVNPLFVEVKDIWSGSEAKREESFGIILIFPMETKKGRVLRAYWYMPEGVFEIPLDQLTSLAHICNCCSCVLDAAVFDIPILFRNSGVD